MSNGRGVLTITVMSDFRIYEAAAGDDETRPTLQAVFVDSGGVVVATDGFILAVVPCKIEGNIESFAGVLIPCDFYARALAEKHPTSKELVFRLEASGISARVKWGEITAPLVPGTFLDWRQTIPEAEQLEASEELKVDPKLLCRLALALGTKWPRVVLGKKDKAHVVLGDNGAFGLIMPLSQSPIEASELKRALNFRSATSLKEA